MKLLITLGVMLLMTVVLVLLPLLSKEGKAKTADTKTFGILGALLVFVAGGTYFMVGSPEVVDNPAFLESVDQTQTNPGDGAKMPSVEDMIDGIRARLAENPENLDDWASLARSLLMMGRYSEAADAYRQALQLAPDVAELHSAYGEALTLMSDGFIMPEAATAFENALLLDPNEFISIFYLGDYAFQEGNMEGAYARWLALYEEVSVDTPWLPLLDQRIREAATRLGVEPPQILTDKQYQDPEDLAGELQGVSSDEQMEMIEGMVAGLAARLEDNPGDLAGWERLGRSYMVLGRYEEGLQAFGMVAGARPDDPTALGQYIQAMMTWLEAAGQHITDPALAALQNLIVLEPENPMALYYLGQAAAERGDKSKARKYWEKLLSLYSPNSEDVGMIQEKLDSLE